MPDTIYAMDFKQRNILLIGLLGIGISFVLIYLWSAGQSSRGYQFETDLYRAIEEQKRSARTPSEEISIRLKDITRFKWDKLYILREDSESESIAHELGIRWPPTNKPIVPLLFIEPFDFLVFVEVRGDARIIYDFRFYRESLSFERLKKLGGWTPDEAVFRYVENPPRYYPAAFLEEVKESVPDTPGVH